MQKNAFGFGSLLRAHFSRRRRDRSMTKILLVMRLTAFLICAALLQVRAAVVAQPVSVSGKNIPLKTVFAEIEKQTGFVVFGSSSLFEQARPVTVSAVNVPVPELLDIVMKGQPIKYFIDAKSIFLFPVTKDAAATPVEDPPVEGLVRDSTGRSLAGASVMNNRTKKTAQSDGNGQFSIEAQEGDLLQISFVGFETQVVTVRRTTRRMTVTMHQKNSMLDETVIIAYGTTTQRFTTGNITSVRAKDIEKQPVQNPLLALQGRVPGMVISQQSGYEHGPIAIEIRGRNSINNAFTSDPLYIIDGVPLTVLDVNSAVERAGSAAISRGLDQAGMSPANGQSPLFNMDPSNIESIEVLKDADATAIYGSRGANGVIIITTKKGKPGKTSFDFTYNRGVRFITRQWDMLNTQEYLAMRREAFQNDGIVPDRNATTGPAKAPDLFSDSTRYTDWQKYAWGRTGEWTKATATISGGNLYTNFRLSGGYGRTTDVTALSGANQNGSLSFNLSNQSIDRRFKLNFTGNYSFNDINTMNSISGLSVTTLPPNAPPIFDETGNLNYLEWKAFGVGFPFAAILQPYRSKTHMLQSSLKLEYNIVRGLNARVNLGYNSSVANQTKFKPAISQDPTSNLAGIGQADFGDNKASNWIIEPQLDYAADLLSGKARLNVLLGGTLQSSVTNGLRTSGNGYTNDALLGSISNALTVDVYERAGEYKYAGAFARLGFRWADRYILSLNGRRDGSSRFGAGHQFGNFGSVGAAWIVNDEPWLAEILPDAISFIKLRGSYGLTGSDAVGDYQFVSRWGNLSPYLQPYNGVAPLKPQIQPNADLHWQVNRKSEGALDLGFFNDRLSLSMALYRNRCNNQLVAYPTPEYSGFSNVVANLPADVLNTGWETTVSGQIIKGGKFSWRADFNISANRNKLLAYPNIEQSPYYDKYIIGQPLNIRFLYHMAGIDPQTGNYVYEDYNHDGKVNKVDGVRPGSGEDDRYAMIVTTPDFSGGFNNEFSYKNLRLTVFFEFVKKLGTNGLRSSYGDAKNMPRWAYENRWRSPGDVSAAPGLVSNRSDGTYISFYTNSDAYYTDASYIRFKTIAFSYFLPEKAARKIGMRRLAVNLNAQNLLTITNYQGLDPDVTSFGSMPPLRTITAGLSCSF